MAPVTHLLLIEPNPLEATRLNGLLASFDVVCAGSFADGLRACGSDRFQVAVVDASMADPTQLGAIEETNPGLPIVVLAEDPDAYRGTRAACVLPKRDLSPDGFAARIRQVVKQQGGAVVDKWASVGRMSAGIAHEINNPAAYLSMNLQMLDEFLVGLEFAGAAEGIEQARELVQQSMHGVQRIVEVSQTLSGFGQPVSKPFLQVQLNEVLADAVALAMHEVRNKAHLEQQVDVLPPIAGDATKLCHAVVGLLMDATDGLSGTETLQLQAKATDGAVEISISQPSGAAGFAGPGLRNARAIIRHHGGTLTASGNLATIVLPGEASEPATPEQARVMIVEDDRPVRRSLARLLSRYHSIIEVEGPTQALAMLNDGVEVDVVLCDLLMPDMDGLAFHQMLVAADNPVAERFVFLTGGPSSEGRRKLLAQSSAEVIRKPPSIQRLLQAIEHAATGATPQGR